MFSYSEESHQIIGQCLLVMASVHIANSRLASIEDLWETKTTYFFLLLSTVSQRPKGIVFVEREKLVRPKARDRVAVLWYGT